jgi:S1-C subfamily serine protease
MLFVSVPVMGADFQKGLDAYKNRDYVTALREWEPLANDGNVKAQYNLSKMYARGQGVPLDFKTAFMWLIRASKQGDVTAQHDLGYMYAIGYGVQKDLVDAYRWITIAASHGHRASMEYQYYLKGLMTSAQVKKALQLASNFVPKKTKPPQTAKVTPQPKPKSKPKRKSKPVPKSGSTGSGFFISKLGHVITNQHVVNKCRKVTVGANANKQVAAKVLETDHRNDLALLRISSTKMASAETKSLISKLGIAVVPLATRGLLRSDKVERGEDVLVAGYPYGVTYSNSMKVTKGIVSDVRGFGNDTGQFQIDAAVQPGNSGGPIYDAHGNIIGVVVSQLNKLKFAKNTGSLPENVNFGIKASTVRQFLNASGLPTKLSERTKVMSTRDLAKIAENQTVMVVCYR